MSIAENWNGKLQPFDAFLIFEVRGIRGREMAVFRFIERFKSAFFELGLDILWNFFYLDRLEIP